MPIGGFSGADGTARIQTVVPFRRILPAHESPWAGYIDCRISPNSLGGSRVRVTVSISEEEIGLLSVGFRLAVPPPSNGHISVGLLTWLSGSNGIFCRSTVNCAQLAIDELNADGGVLGQQVSLSVADDATNPVVGQISMERLLKTLNLSAVIGYHNSATFTVEHRWSNCGSLCHAWLARPVVLGGLSPETTTSGPERSLLPPNRWLKEWPGRLLVKDSCRSGLDISNR